MQAPNLTKSCHDANWNPERSCLLPDWKRLWVVEKSLRFRSRNLAHNPKTGESIEISASRSAKFKPGKQLKDSLNDMGAASQPSTPPT
jgi:hypothetical protein